MKNLTITLAIIISLFFIAVSFVADKNEDLSQYYFTGKIDLHKYPEFKNCGYKEDPEVKFHIYDNKIFIECRVAFCTECDRDFGHRVYKMIDGKYKFIANNNLNLSLVSSNGKIEELKIVDRKKLENKSRLDLKNNSCEIAKFISQFNMAYYFNEIKSSKKKDHKLYKLGYYDDKNNSYDFSQWFLDLVYYKNLKMAVFEPAEENDVKFFNGNNCLKKIFQRDQNYSEDNLVIIKNCKAKEADIYLKINNCIVTKYQDLNSININIKNQ